MKNDHDIEERIARFGQYACMFAAGGLTFRGAQNYAYARDLPPSKEAGNAAVTSQIEVMGALLMLVIGYRFHRAAQESYQLLLDHEAEQKPR